MTARAPPPPWFLFIRHGETDWNAEGRLQGGRDVSLNARGRRQAADAGRHVAAFLAREGRSAADIHMVTSPLGRTRETAAAVRVVLGLDPAAYEVDERLQEFSFGLWEGLTWSEVKARDPHRHKERRRDKWRFVPPEGESYAMLAERVAGWLGTVGEGVIAVSHGGVARVLMVLAGGLSPLAAPNTEVPQGRVIRFADRRFTWL